MRKNILIIVPAYNEEKSLSFVISDIQRCVPTADIVVVNDGSDDRTGEIAQKENVFILNLLENLGIGAAIQTGYKFAYYMGYDIAVQCDGDGQHPADQIPRLIEPIIRGECDAVLGSRFLGQNNYKASMPRRIGMKIFSFIISLILRQEITDTTSGFRAINREAIKSFSIYYPCDYPEVEALVFLHKEGFSIKEIPITMRKRNKGKSSITYYKSIYYMFKVLLAISLDLFRDMPYKKGE